MKKLVSFPEGFFSSKRWTLIIDFRFFFLKKTCQSENKWKHLKTSEKEKTFEFYDHQLYSWFRKFKLWMAGDVKNRKMKFCI